MLDQGLLDALPDQHKNAVREYEETFATPGWKRIEKYLNESIKEIEQRIIHATTWDANRLLYGKLYTLTELVNLPLAMENEFRALAEQARESEAEEFELEFE